MIARIVRWVFGPTRRQLEADLAEAEADLLLFAPTGSVRPGSWLDVYRRMERVDRLRAELGRPGMMQEFTDHKETP